MCGKMESMKGENANEKGQTRFFSLGGCEPKIVLTWVLNHKNLLTLQFCAHLDCQKDKKGEG